MAEQNQQSEGTRVANAVSKAAGAAKSAAAAVKAAAKAAAGDIAGAILDVVKNPELLRAIVITVVTVCFLVVFVFLAVGAAIVQMIQMIVEQFNAYVIDYVEQEALINGGNKLSLITSFSESSYAAVWQMLCNLFTGDENHSGETDFDKKDYQNTIDSAIDEEAFAGRSGALQTRLDLIKNRVLQRGVQLLTAFADYAWDGIGISLALSVCEKTNNFFLYNGIGDISVNVDITCFTLTDIQCIKILAAYCAQNECDVQSADLWGLMNYLGWYSLDSGSSSMQDSQNAGTIYDTPLLGRFVEEFYGAYSAGTVVGAGETSSIELSAPSIPVWEGSFVPQYVLEEMKQLVDMEKEGKIVLPRDGNNLVKWEECCPNYEYYGGMGIIDYIFTGSAFASFSRTDYTGIDATMDEFLEELVSKNLEKIADWWKSFWGNDTPEPTFANVEKNGINEKCTVTQQIYADGSPSTYMVSVDNDLYYKEPFTMVIAQSGTENYIEMDRSIDINDPINGKKFFYKLKLDPNTEYSIFLRSPSFSGGYTYSWIDSFTTVFDTEDGELYQAYQINIAFDITYRARSIDELAFDIIGLWPGALSEVEMTTNGSLRAAGHTDNPLLKLNWRDYISDKDGNVHSLEFTRLRGNQYEYYVDYVQGIAATLGKDTTGLLTPEYSYGDTLVSIASDELSYYEKNGLYSGYRYWDICSSVTGENYKKESQNGTDWSAVFVLCCAYQCGFIGDGNCFGDFGCDSKTWPVNSAELYNALREYSSADRHENSGYRPVSGDLVFFSTMGAGSRLPDQVGIVVGVTSDNKLITIEGSSHDEVQKCEYSSYKVGAYAYGSGSNTMYISSYISPDYGVQLSFGTQYMNNHSLINNHRSNATQIHINSTPTTTVVVGAGRFRLSQLRDVLNEIERTYSHLLTDEYATVSGTVDRAVTRYENNSLATGDISNLVLRWSEYEASAGADLQQALAEIAARQYVGPLAEQIKKANGFDWNKTTVRQEILWQIATSTDQIHIARRVLDAFVLGKDNNLSDADLLTSLMSQAQVTAENGTISTLQISVLEQILEEYRGALWPEDHTKLQDAWIDCAKQNMNVIRTKFINGTLS